MSLAFKWGAAILLTLGLVPSPGSADEELSRPLTIHSLPTQLSLPPDEALSRPLTLVFLPARAAPNASEAISRAVSHMSLPARRPPANDEVVAQSFTIETPGISLDVRDTPPRESPRLVSLSGAAPNPFRRVTRIRYSLADPALISVKIFDLAGRLVCTVFDGQASAGDHVTEWNGTAADDRRVAAGVYLCRLEIGSLRHTRRLVVLE